MKYLLKPIYKLFKWIGSNLYYKCIKPIAEIIYYIVAKITSFIYRIMKGVIEFIGKFAKAIFGGIYRMLRGIPRCVNGILDSF